MFWFGVVLGLWLVVCCDCECGFNSMFAVVFNSVFTFWVILI